MLLGPGLGASRRSQVAKLVMMVVIVVVVMMMVVMIMVVVMMLVVVIIMVLVMIKMVMRVTRLIIVIMVTRARREQVKQGGRVGEDCGQAVRDCRVHDGGMAAEEEVFGLRTVCFATEVFQF